jgi:hypothetical protein
VENCDIVLGEHDPPPVSRLELPKLRASSTGTRNIRSSELGVGRWTLGVGRLLPSLIRRSGLKLPNNLFRALRALCR